MNFFWKVFPIYFIVYSAVASTGDNLVSSVTTGNDVCDLVKDNDRLDCFPQGSVTKETCEARGCCWKENVPNIPYCFYKSKAPSYIFKNITKLSNGIEGYLERVSPSPYPRDISLLKLSATYESDAILRIKIVDPSNQRYESTYPKQQLPLSTKKNPLYNIEFQTDKQGFRVIRSSDKVTIFDASDLSNFIYSDQFIQFTTKLPSKNIYGLGEHKERFRLNSNWTTYTMFTRDSAPYTNTNLYGSHPFYLMMEESSKAHGVFLKSSSGMDVILQPSPAITYRTIGGILDFYILLGPTPAEVLKQYQQIIGKPKMPPYWSLGFHLCRYGIRSLDTTKKTLQRNLDAGVPIETQWNDLDYMEKNNDFTYSKDSFEGLPEFVDSLHKQGRRYVILIDPGVSSAEPAGSYPPYDEGVKLDVFIKNSTGSILVAKVWNTISTAFPDFTNPNALTYWKSMIKAFHDVVPFDGAWIDMNEPSNFYDGSDVGCPISDLESPPYVPHVLDGHLSAKTVCMTAKQYAGVHYDLHNLYGISEAEVTSRALSEVLGERSLVISRSTFPGSGVYGGHWSGDIFSTWEDLRYSIPQLLDFSLYGIPLMGADICGFNWETDADLCNRWMQLGAFYPFSRNHNSIDMKEQDPVAMGEQVVRSSVKALRIRYTLLPYLYTLFWQASQDGSTVARALLLEFPDDLNTYDIDTSFMWGSGLLIAPVLENDPKSIETYLPRGIWYDYYTRDPIRSSGEYYEIATDKDTIPLFIRGGQILITQSAENTTEEVRNSPYRIVAALNEYGYASGQFYWDDGLSVDVGEDYTLLSFEVRSGLLSINPLHIGRTKMPALFSVEILGIQFDHKKDNIINFYRADSNKKTLLMENLNITEYPVTLKLE